MWILIVVVGLLTLFEVAALERRVEELKSKDVEEDDRPLSEYDSICLEEYGANG